MQGVFPPDPASYTHQKVQTWLQFSTTNEFIIVPKIQQMSLLSHPEQFSLIYPLKFCTCIFCFLLNYSDPIWFDLIYSDLIQFNLD